MWALADFTLAAFLGWAFRGCNYDGLVLRGPSGPVIPHMALRAAWNIRKLSPSGYAITQVRGYLCFSRKPLSSHPATWLPAPLENSALGFTKIGGGSGGL